MSRRNFRKYVCSTEGVLYKTGNTSTFAAIYFKSSIRTNPATGEPEGYYRLIERFRNVAGKVCHRTLLNVGFMGGVRAEELNRIQKLLTCKCHSSYVDLFNLEYENESALVINQYGFIKYTSILQCNVSEPSTLEAMIKELRSKTFTTAEKALVVIDAGIATAENLKKILDAGYDYLCVSRSRLKDYETVDGNEALTVEDNRKRKIRLQKVNSSNAAGEGDACYLKVESLSKKKKERSINDNFSERYLKGLEAIA